MPSGGFGDGPGMGGTLSGERVPGNNGPVSTATASSFLNVAGTMGG